MFVRVGWNEKEDVLLLVLEGMGAFVLVCMVL